MDILEIIGFVIGIGVVAYFIFFRKRNVTKKQLRHNADAKFYNQDDSGYTTIENGVVTYHRKKK